MPNKTTKIKKAWVITLEANTRGNFAGEFVENVLKSVIAAISYQFKSYKVTMKEQDPQAWMNLEK